MPTGPTAAPVHVSSQSFPLSHSSFCQVGRLTPESMCWFYSDAAVVEQNGDGSCDFGTDVTMVNLAQALARYVRREIACLSLTGKLAMMQLGI